MEGFTLFRAVLAVVAVLLLAYYCSRLLGKQGVKASGSGHLNVIESIQVGQDRRILLLKVGDHHYLVGVSQAGIQLLAEVEGDFQAGLPESGGSWPDTENARDLLPFRQFLEKMMPPDKKVSFKEWKGFRKDTHQIKEEEDDD